MKKNQSEGTAKWLRVTLLVGLAILCFCVIRPFGSAMIWAAILSFTLHPLQKRFTAWMGGREFLAALSLTILMVVILLIPLSLLGMSLVDNGKTLIEESKQQIINAPEKTPAWLSRIPLVGSDIEVYWAKLIESREDWAGEEISPDAQENDADESAAVGRLGGNSGSLLDQIMKWASNGFVLLAKILWNGLTQISIALVLVFFLLKDAPRIGERIHAVAERVGGSKGLELLELAGVTVKGVVNGVLGTALVQGIVAGIGFLIVGVPGAIFLGALTFFVAVLPIGPPMVWGGVAAWLFLKGDTGWGVFMIIYGSVVISSLDNVVRPLLIGNENRMPFALILFGLIGGVMAFGLVGLFVGPTLLTLAYRLVKGWTDDPRFLTNDDDDDDESVEINLFS